MRLALAILVSVGVLAIIENILGDIVASLLQDQLGDYAWLIVVLFIVIAAVLLGFGLRDQVQALLQDRRPAFDRRNWQAMLDKLRASYTYRLQRSLVHEVLIALDLAERAAAVVRPLDLLVQRPDHADLRLPQGIRVAEMFDELGGTLLILGEPGAGKTTLLLDLALDLLGRAAQDTAHPIPVVFQLSSWAQQRRPLVDWLVDALHEQYEVPRKIGQAWVEADEILPLLDGLDEVKAEHRAACVETINSFRQDHGLLPLVVCSRTGDYEALGMPLRLQGALVVQPLTRAQVDSYLAQVGAPLAPVRQAVQDDPTLWELLDTPLMLAVVTGAYAGQAGETLPVRGTLAERRQHLFAIYVDRMFRRRKAITAYTREQTERWLTWLAWQMTQHSQSVFYLERMQFTWLHDRFRSRVQNFRWRTTLRVGALVFLLTALAAGPLIGFVAGLAAVAGVCVGTLRSFRDVNEEMRRRAAATGVCVGGGRSVKEIAEELWRRAAAGGPHPTMMMQEVMQWSFTSEDIISVETLHWSWSGLEPQQWRILLFIIIPIFALAIGLGLGVGTWLRMAVTVGLNEGVAVGLNAAVTTGLETGGAVGLFAGVAATLFWGLVLIPEGALASSEIETKTVPNQGIHRSARNALFMGLIGGMVGGIASGFLAVLSYALGFKPIIGVLSVLGFVLSFGLAAAMRYGGYTWLQHRRLRRLLVRHGAIPRHYVDFLDYAVERIFLRRDGGGYIFIHRLLRDYFASLYKCPSCLPTPRSAPAPSGEKGARPDLRIGRRQG